MFTDNTSAMAKLICAAPVVLAVVYVLSRLAFVVGGVS